MRPVNGFLILTAAVALIAPGRAVAQDSTVMDRRQAAMVLDHTWDSPIGEPVRVFLAKGMKYRVTVQGSGIQLGLRPLMSSTPAPLIQPLLAGSSAGDEKLYTVTPRADAEYQFETTGGSPGVPVRLRVAALPTKSKPKP